jgi:glutathione synthase/RimK-type ligase-like ATP-grasp enzyme
MILVITAPTDAHAEPVLTRLAARHVPVLRLDPSDFPTRTTLTFRSDARQRRLSLGIDASAPIDLDTITAGWFRRPGRPKPDDAVATSMAPDVIDQSQAFVENIWASMNMSWLPASPAQLGIAGKLTQLQLAAEIGFEIPPTLVTNDPNEFVSFYREHNGNVVSKLIGRSSINSAQSAFARFTEVVAPASIVEADAVRLCPVIFQANLPKREELRVTVVGDEVFGAAIQSQVTSRTKTDWRRYDQRHTPVLRAVLPDRVIGQCRALVSRLGLSFATIDLVVTPDDRVVFLELNANGQYLWIERATGLPISEAVAGWLERQLG